MRITKRNISLLLASFAAAALVLPSCSSSEVIEDFEGDLTKWTIEGDSFASTSQDPALKGFQGRSYLKSSENEALKGNIASDPFTINRKYINLLVAGNRAMMGRSPLSVSLIVSGEPVRTARPIGSDPYTFEWVSWDISDLHGKKAVIRIASAEALSYGGRTIPKGFIAVDQIEQGSRRLSTYLEEYAVTLRADSKYILIPASNSGSSSRLSIEVDGENILGNPQSVRPSVDQIDYYIPVDVQKYIGKDVTVRLTGIRTTDSVYGAIRTSDDNINPYDETYRPLVHFSPSFGWTNDPNGMVYTPQGKWHLSLQYNPYGTSHGNMHWGLAESDDLIHWKDYPAIIAPDELGSIFSGSAVVDKQNTAGFGKDAIVGIYTSAGSGQRQSIAYSTDGGYTFTKYDRNPVLADPEERDFRDPKVSWIGDKWVMVLAVGQVVRFYGSDDLKEWSLLSEFGTGIGSHDGVWECPDLMCFDYQGSKKWVLFVSINPGGPNGGSITQYFVGDFDGKRFKADKLPYPLWVDEGVDNYAGVTYANTEGRTVFQGWMSNWVYTGATPTVAFRNSMTLPRDLSLKSNGRHVILSSVPSPEVYAARSDGRDISGSSAVKDFTISPILQDNKGAYEIDVTIVPSSEGQFTLTLSNSKAEKVDFTFDTEAKTLSMDRSRSGNVSFSPSFAKEPVVVSLNPRKEYKIQLFVDRLSTEMFINDGDMVFTNCVFPTEVLNIFDISSAGCSLDIRDVSVYALQ